MKIERTDINEGILGLLLFLQIISILDISRCLEIANLLPRLQNLIFSIPGCVTICDTVVIPQANFLWKITFDMLYTNRFLIRICSRTLSISSERNTI